MAGRPCRRFRFEETAGIPSTLIGSGHRSIARGRADKHPFPTRLKMYAKTGAQTGAYLPSSICTLLILNGAGVSSAPH